MIETILSLTHANMRLLACLFEITEAISSFCGMLKSGAIFTSNGILLPGILSLAATTCHT